MPEAISEREAAELIKGMGRAATVVVHDNRLVTASAIFANTNAAERQRIQNEVDGLLQSIQRKYRIVKMKRAAEYTAAIANRVRAKLLKSWRSLGESKDALKTTDKTRTNRLDCCVGDT